MTRVGVIGCGLMGSACARRLMQADFEVLAHDIDETKLAALAAVGAQRVSSLKEMVQACDTLVIAVFNTDQVEAVIEGSGGVLDAMKNASQARVLICVST